MNPAVTYPFIVSFLDMTQALKTLCFSCGSDVAGVLCSTTRWGADGGNWGRGEVGGMSGLTPLAVYRLHPLPSPVFFLLSSTFLFPFHQGRRDGLR